MYYFFSGDTLDDKAMLQSHYDKMTALQHAVFAKYPEMRNFALATVASIDDRTNLEKHFKNLSKETLYDIAEYLFLVPPLQGHKQKLEEYNQDFLVELLIHRHEKRESQLQELNEMPLYPTEDVIWDENIVPGEYYNGEGVLALPKLNLQFLTLHDYLLRNFKLFQLESTYEIRGDVEDAVSRLKPWSADTREVIFGGWARMALPITSFSIVEVAKPNIGTILKFDEIVFNFPFWLHKFFIYIFLGEKQPSRVRADVSVTLSVKDAIKNEWENLRRHDVCFLITVRPPISAAGQNFNYLDDFMNQAGLIFVRGCEVEGMLDENGRVIEEGPEPKPVLKGESRSYRVLLGMQNINLDYIIFVVLKQFLKTVPTYIKVTFEGEQNLENFEKLLIWWLFLLSHETSFPINFSCQNFKTKNK